MRVALRNCWYPELALRKGALKGKKQRPKDTTQKDGERTDKPKSFALLPYVKGITERLQWAFRKHDIALYAKAGYTVRNADVSPKDPLNLNEQCGVAYISQCDLCGEQYVGETGISLGEMCEEHDKMVGKGDSSQH